MKLTWGLVAGQRLELWGYQREYFTEAPPDLRLYSRDGTCSCRSARSVIRYPITAFIGALLLGSGVLDAQSSRNGESRLDTELLRVISWVRTRPYDSIQLG